MTTGKRSGRFGEVTNPTLETRSGPLPLMTQPMIPISLEDGDPSMTRSDNPLATRIDNPLTTMKADTAAVRFGRPTQVITTAAKAPIAVAPVGPPPEIGLTQHHLPDNEPADRRLSLVIDPDSERAAAFRVLRHHLLEVGRAQTVIVSSPQPGEGKTTTAVNLALALAECGRAKVLLVETNLKRPALASIFKFVPPWCFAEQLAAHRHQPMMPWSLIEIPQLWLHVGAIHTRNEKSQLLDGPAFAIAMERLRLGGYDHIVVDGPPVLGSADVNLMADAADTVVFAVRSKRTTTRDLRKAMEQLGADKVAGTILVED